MKAPLQITTRISTALFTTNTYHAVYLFSFCTETVEELGSLFPALLSYCRKEIWQAEIIILVDRVAIAVVGWC